MYQIKPSLTLNNIHKRKSEEDIIQYLFPSAKKNNSFSIRKEKLNSANITEFRGKLYIKDFGDPTQPKAETWYQWIARDKGWDCSTTEGFLKALNWANITFKLGLQEPTFQTNTQINKIIKPIIQEFNRERLPVKIEVSRTNWNKKYLAYWEQFGITLEQLKSKNISPIKYLWITNPNKENIQQFIDVSNRLTYIYPYYWDKATFMYKVYSPLEKQFKWLSNANSHVIENWRFIKEHRKNLIIQSSLKDIMVMEYFRDNYGIFKDYDFISPISEGIFFNGNWDLIKSKYNKILYYGNNDLGKETNPGLEYARKWSNLYNIPFIVNPDWCKASDISDYRRDNGELKTKQLLLEIEEKIQLL
jgi:hypothetical protein